MVGLEQVLHAQEQKLQAKMTSTMKLLQHRQHEQQQHTAELQAKFILDLKKGAVALQVS